jgi:hypothetical protein
MGQMTYGVMYGVRVKPPSSLIDGWATLLEKYQCPDEFDDVDVPHGDGPYDFVGIWCAMGASGLSGVPNLNTPFCLEDFARTEGYKEISKDAIRSWVPFAKWAKGQEFNFPSPKFWLVMTEVA